MERSRVSANTPRALTGVVLAAGASRRMGRPKLLLPWRDDTVLGRTLDNARLGGISPLTVVCGAEYEAVAAVAKAKGVSWLLNENYEQGQSSSLICGLTAALPGCGLMFILGDMPAVTPSSYATLATAYTQSMALIIVPINKEGRRGNPTVWAPQLFCEIAQLSGDSGARGLMEKYRVQTLFVPMDESGLYTDVDTPEDYLLLTMYDD